MKTYPIMMDMRNRLAVVVGAGPVGLRKVHSLLEAGAQVKLVADQLPDHADQLSQAGVTIIHKPYCAEFLDGAILVFACTDDRAVNAQIAQDARWAGAIVNAADQPEDCDFFLPAVVKDGDVIVAVGTGGSSPGLAGAIRDRLAAALPPQIGAFAALLDQIRLELKTQVPDLARRGRIMKDLSSPATYDAFIARGENALRDRLSVLLK